MVQNSQSDCKVSTPGALQVPGCWVTYCLGLERDAGPYQSRKTVRATLRFGRYFGSGLLSHDRQVLVNQNCVLVQLNNTESVG